MNMTAKIKYTGQSDFSDKMIEEEGIGCFARGATGRVCLVLVGHPEDGFFKDKEYSTIQQVQKWAESVPGGHLDY